MIGEKGSVAELCTIKRNTVQRYAIGNLGAKITSNVKICGEGRIPPKLLQKLFQSNIINPRCIL